MCYMPKVFTSNKQKIGKLGEGLAKKFLMKHGYLILAENYTKKYGEIDLIAKKGNIVTFVEVKSIIDNNVPHETYDPLQNIHPGKLKRLSRVIQVYLLNMENKVSRETKYSRNNEIKWQFDVIVVKINEKERIGRVKHIKDIII